jgi:hypothetical protein
MHRIKNDVAAKVPDSASNGVERKFRIPLRVGRASKGWNFTAPEVQPSAEVIGLAARALTLPS